MKTFIKINDSAALQERLLAGKRVEGVLFMDMNTGTVTFKAYNRQSKVRQPDKIIRRLEHGWVKESKRRLKIFESVPKGLGMDRVLGVMGRDFDEAADALIELDIASLKYARGREINY